MTCSIWDDLTLTAERRPVTVLVADMVGFTAFTEAAGEEAAYGLMRLLHRLMADAVRQQGGQVKEFTGDGIIALFGTPALSENSALSACRAALSIQQCLAARAGELGEDHGVRPELRIGIAAGSAVVAGRFDLADGGRIAVFGDAVNLAAHLQSLAEPGAVLVSEPVWQRVRGLVEGRFGGRRTIKGKTETQRLYQIDAIRRDAPRFASALARGLSMLVGRGQELEALRRGVEAAPSSLRVIDIMGGPGIGKSRLIHEVRRWLDGQGTIVLAGNCREDGRNAPFLPILEILRAAIETDPGALELEAARLLAARLSAAGRGSMRDRARALDLLGVKATPVDLTGIEGGFGSVPLRELLEKVLEPLCRSAPLVLILEDLQWIDRASEELILQLMDGGGRLPLTLLEARRPEYRPPWLGRAGTATLTLGPLAPGEALRIVEGRVGPGTLPKTLERSILDRAQGNPLFAEELADAFLERGAQPRMGGGLDEAVTVATVPERLQSLLTARLDDLAPGDRALLQVASVIGQRFSPALLAATIRPPADLDARLGALLRLGLLRSEGSSTELSFAHRLMRDMLYESLMSARRAALHLRIARAIEGLSAPRGGEMDAALAHHYAKTGAAGRAGKYRATARAKNERPAAMPKPAPVSPAP